MINWFEWDKYEAEVSNRVDWTVTRDPSLASAFRQAIPASTSFAADAGCPAGAARPVRQPASGP